MDVQVQIVPGLVRFVIVGLPDKAVNESSELVRSALHASGLALPAIVAWVIANLFRSDKDPKISVEQFMPHAPSTGGAGGGGFDLTQMSPETMRLFFEVALGRSN